MIQIAEFLQHASLLIDDVIYAVPYFLVYIRCAQRQRQSIFKKSFIYG